MKTLPPIIPQTPPSPGERGRRGLFAMKKRRPFSPLMLIGAAITLFVIIGSGTYFLVLPRLRSHAAGVTVNMDCTLIVPANPLTAQGLATPYQLVATDPNNGPCNEANATQGAFVEGAVVDPATGQISVYDPLVIDQGTKAAIDPVVPQLPNNAVVALWFGFNGGNLTLQSSQNSLQDGVCVNGVNGSIFGQFANCNAPAFFQAANKAIQAGQLVPPPLATASDGKPCPTVRDFGVVDQDQSDNVTTVYLTTQNGLEAQMTAANMATLQNAQVQANGSDNRLLDAALDGALGCTPWSVPNLADPGHTATALPLNELQAAAHQAAPVALVPANDPMVLNNNNQDLAKLNAYRVAVDQAAVNNLAAASPKAYCQRLVNTGAPRIVLDAPFTIKGATPDPGTGNTLFTFLAQRFVNSYGNLNCQQFLGKPSPIATTQDGNGAATSATFNGQAINTQQMTGNGTTTPTCIVNKVMVIGCAGTVKVNDQSCIFSFVNHSVTVSVNCQTIPGQGNGNGNGNPGPALTFNNAGSSNDNAMQQGNFDSWGNSYSAQALQNAGLTPGVLVNFNGVTFTWPKADAGTPNNIQAQGQVIPVNATKGATVLAFLGASTNGPSMGNATITYTDGTTQTFNMAFSDWTLGTGQAALSQGNQVVAVMPYRNTATNGIQFHQPHVFYVDVALQPGKTVKSVTLPLAINQGHIHIFAVGMK